MEEEKDVELHKDFKFHKNTFTLIIDGTWLHHLEDFGIVEEDFEKLGNELARLIITMVAEMVGKKYRDSVPINKRNI